MEYDVVIVGGGLAGLTAAIHLKTAGIEVLVVEKQRYPNHKVCGEYVSNEVKPYLLSLGIPLEKIQTPEITTLQLSTQDGGNISVLLPLGGFGISRYAFDLLLYETALEKGVPFIFDAVNEIDFRESHFQLSLAKSPEISAKLVIGAYGKRSLLDKNLDRGFMAKKSPWLGVKCHYELESFPKNLVGLHSFNGGYGGLSATEDGSVNFCYLTTFKSFKSSKSIQEFNSQVVGKNPFLHTFLSKATPKFEKPLSIAQISFEQKLPVENHILMCGDSAGLIHPLCGNGMAMAIHAAKIASECIVTYLSSAEKDRLQLEVSYTRLWNAAFKHRLWMGRRLQSILLSKTLSKISLSAVTKSETILQTMIRRTHGKPILV